MACAAADANNPGATEKRDRSRHQTCDPWWRGGSPFPSGFGGRDFRARHGLWLVHRICGFGVNPGSLRGFRHPPDLPRPGMRTNRAGLRNLSSPQTLQVLLCVKNKSRRTRGNVVCVVANGGVDEVCPSLFKGVIARQAGDNVEGLGHGPFPHLRRLEGKDLSPGGESLYRHQVTDEYHISQLKRFPGSRP